MATLACPTDRLAGMDFDAHNAEVREVWAAFRSGKPIRIPCILGTATRFFMFHPEANAEGMDFRTYSEDPAAMYETALRFARWSRFNLLQDSELGLPERWGIGVDFQNYYEAAWFGCPIFFEADQVPDTLPAYIDEPERLLENGLPDPFDGLFARGLEFFEWMKDRAQREGYLDRPVDVWAPGGGTDGPFTAACNLFGPEFACATLLEDPDRIHRLLDFITEAIILRMAAWRGLSGLPEKTDGFWMADDSIALLSTEVYREHIASYHRRIYDAFATPIGRGMHLCGDSTRHFPTIVRKLGVSSFDTGFPVDFGALRRTLGPEITIQGGPHIAFLLKATPTEVEEECQRILASGILDGPFVLREGNNLAPGTPIENTEAMFRVARQTRL